jgi:hypothetical protein
LPADPGDRHGGDGEYGEDAQPEKPVRLQLLARPLELIVRGVPAKIERATEDLHYGCRPEKAEKLALVEQGTCEPATTCHGNAS